MIKSLYILVKYFPSGISLSARSPSNPLDTPKYTVNTISSIT